MGKRVTVSIHSEMVTDGRCAGCGKVDYVGVFWNVSFQGNGPCVFLVPYFSKAVFMAECVNSMSNEQANCPNEYTSRGGLRSATSHC